MRAKLNPALPHNWDAHLWFEESEKILFSSDFCCQGGISDPISDTDLSKKIISFYESENFIPYGKSTIDSLKKIECLGVRHIAPMHGSVLKDNHARSVLASVSKDLINKST